MQKGLRGSGHWSRNEATDEAGGVDFPIRTSTLLAAVKECQGNVKGLIESNRV